MDYYVFISVSLEHIKHVYSMKKNFLHAIKISSPKEIKNFKLIKTMRKLKNLEDAIEEINRIEGTQMEIIK